MEIRSSIMTVTTEMLDSFNEVYNPGMQVLNISPKTNCYKLELVGEFYKIIYPRLEFSINTVGSIVLDLGNASNFKCLIKKEEKVMLLCTHETTYYAMELTESDIIDGGEYAHDKKRFKLLTGKTHDYKSLCPNIPKTLSGVNLELITCVDVCVMRRSIKVFENGNNVPLTSNYIYNVNVPVSLVAVDKISDCDDLLVENDYDLSMRNRDRMITITRV